MRTRRKWLQILAVAALAAPVVAQDFRGPTPEKGRIADTVIDVNNDAVSGVTVVLEGSGPTDPRTAVSNENGFFEFKDLDPGIYHVNITAAGFATWTSPAVVVEPGQYVLLPGARLKIAEALTTISVVYSQEQVATEQVRIAEQQRVFRIIPNFYVVYDPDAAPLTTKLKFQLALKTSVDPVTVIGTGLLAAMYQAGDTPDYGQGMQAYGKRVGAIAAGGVSNIMIGGAILPSLLHQDPRYFYQGTGTKKSRIFHALSSPFICKGDNGRLQPNYSSVGGDLAAAALSNAYLPASNRGAGMVFQNVLINSGERMLNGVIQEFILRKLTSRGKTRD